MSVFDSIFQIVTQLIDGIEASADFDGASGVLDWVGQFLHMIVTSPVLLLFCVALPLVGLGIGIIRRLVNIRA